MKALDINEVIQIFKKRDHKPRHFMNRSSHKFLNNIVLTKVTDFFDENIKYTREDLTEMVQSVLKNRRYRFENRECVENALESYSRSKEPFSECLNDSVNKTYEIPEEPLQKSNLFLRLITTLIVKQRPGEETIRSLTPSNLPIRF